jgi:exonuclease III
MASAWSTAGDGVRPIRVVSFNVGLKALDNTVRTISGTLQQLLVALDADILCFQEVKHTGIKDLREETALAPGYTTFVSSNRRADVYAGVATIVRNDLPVFGVLEGLTGVLAPQPAAGRGLSAENTSNSSSSSGAGAGIGSPFDLAALAASVRPGPQDWPSAHLLSSAAASSHAVSAHSAGAAARGAATAADSGDGGVVSLAEEGDADRFASRASAAFPGAPGAPAPAPAYSDLQLDSEGRTLVTDHGLFVLVNTYCPALASEGRGPFKAQYHAQLAALCRALAAAGRRVLLVGDLNVAHTELDHRDAEGWTERHGGAAFQREPHRLWMDRLLGCAPGRPFPPALVGRQRSTGGGGTGGAGGGGGGGGAFAAFAAAMAGGGAAAAAGAATVAGDVAGGRAGTRRAAADASPVDAAAAADAPLPPTVLQPLCGARCPAACVLRLGGGASPSFELDGSGRSDDDRCSSGSGRSDDGSACRYSSSSSSSSSAAAAASAAPALCVHFNDTFRRFHPGRARAFTCWNQMTGARQTNFGSRIDYCLMSANTPLLRLPRQQERQAALQELAQQALSACPGKPQAALQEPLRQLPRAHGGADGAPLRLAPLVAPAAAAEPTAGATASAAMKRKPATAATAVRLAPVKMAFAAFAGTAGTACAGGAAVPAVSSSPSNSAAAMWNEPGAAAPVAAAAHFATPTAAAAAASGRLAAAAAAELAEAVRVVLQHGLAVLGADILPDVPGSDHCPVYVDLVAPAAALARHSEAAAAAMAALAVPRAGASSGAALSSSGASASATAQLAARVLPHPLSLNARPEFAARQASLRRFFGGAGAGAGGGALAAAGPSASMLCGAELLGALTFAAGSSGGGGGVAAASHGAAAGTQKVRGIGAAALFSAAIMPPGRGSSAGACAGGNTGGDSGDSGDNEDDGGDDAVVELLSSDGSQDGDGGGGGGCIVGFGGETGCNARGVQASSRHSLLPCSQASNSSTLAGACGSPFVKAGAAAAVDITASRVVAAAGRSNDRDPASNTAASSLAPFGLVDRGSGGGRSGGRQTAGLAAGAKATAGAGKTAGAQAPAGAAQATGAKRSRAAPASAVAQRQGTLSFGLGGGGDAGRGTDAGRGPDAGSAVGPGGSASGDAPLGGAGGAGAPAGAAKRPRTEPHRATDSAAKGASVARDGSSNSSSSAPAAGGPTPAAAGAATAAASALWRSMLKGPVPPPLCLCGIAARTQTAGPGGSAKVSNVGQKFYCCSKPEGRPGEPGARCKYFRWQRVWQAEYDRSQQQLQLQQQQLLLLQEEEAGGGCSK